MIVVGLLELDDRSDWSFLQAHALKADQYSACWAAQAIAGRDRKLGLKIMRHILGHGTGFGVKWGMVEKIVLHAGLGHVWTADGFAEARFWVKQQLAKAGGL